MARDPVRAEPPHNDRDDYFISMTDMMVGMIFLFIIMLMFFALKFETAADKSAALVKSYESTEAVRDNILANIKQDMETKGFTVQIYPSRGALSLPEHLLFERGRSELMPEGEDAIRELAKVLYQNIYCFTKGSAPLPTPPCSATPHAVEAVLIEGHTDADGDFNANWDLSVKRSFATYRSLVAASPALERLLNKEERPIFSIAGYGRQRPIAPNDSAENKAKNRRVDIRLLMLPPKASDLGGKS